MGKKKNKRKAPTKSALAKARREEWRKSKKTYHEYLLTSHWRKFRLRAIEYYGAKCQVCGSYEKLHVHHHNYDRLFDERYKDVGILCEDCHGLEHEDKYTPTDDLSVEYRTIFG